MVNVGTPAGDCSGRRYACQAVCGAREGVPDPPCGHTALGRQPTHSHLSSHGRFCSWSKAVLCGCSHPLLLPLPSSKNYWLASSVVFADPHVLGTTSTFLKKNLKMLKTSDCDVGRWSESAKVVTVCEAYSSCHTLVHPKWMHLSGPSAGGDGGQAGSCCRLSINSRKRSCLAHFLGACMLGSMGVASLSLARKVSEKLLS